MKEVNNKMKLNNKYKILFCLLSQLYVVSSMKYSIN